MVRKIPKQKNCKKLNNTKKTLNIKNGGQNIKKLAK